MAINKGLALVSVADVLFFNPVTDAYMGEGLALTDSTITQEMQNIETRGGYLNALLFSINHSKSLTVNITSATFKMEYLAFQTGTPIVSGLSGVYKFDECVSFKNGIGSTAETPLGKVWVRMPNGVVTGFEPTGKQVDIGMSTFNGQLQVVYQFNKNVNQITIDTKTQPLTVKAVLRIHTLTQDGEEGYLEVTVPRLKFDGSIELSLTSDGVSTFGLSGNALEVADDCGSAYYAEAKFYSETTEETPVYAIAAVPNLLAIAPGGNGTIQLMGLRNSPYANVLLDNTKVTFRSASEAAATVDENGVVTKVGEDPTTITATYQGLSETINITKQPAE